MDALTPADVTTPTGLPDSGTRPSHHSVSTHPRAPRRRFRTLPLSSPRFPSGSASSPLPVPPVPQQRPPASRPLWVGPSQVWTSPFTRRLVALSGRIEFVILRTGGSPPVASHPASRRRGFGQFRAGERLPDGDFHPADWVPSRAHERGDLRRPGVPDGSGQSLSW